MTQLEATNLSKTLSNAPGPYFDAVTPGYIESMGMKILNGRDFRDSDANNEPNDLKKAKWRVA